MRAFAASMGQGSEQGEAVICVFFDDDDDYYYYPSLTEPKVVQGYGGRLQGPGLREREKEGQPEQ